MTKKNDARERIFQPFMHLPNISESCFCHSISSQLTLGWAIFRFILINSFLCDALWNSNDEMNKPHYEEICSVCFCSPRQQNSSPNDIWRFTDVHIKILFYNKVQWNKMLRLKAICAKCLFIILILTLQARTWGLKNIPNVSSSQRQ